MGVVLEGRGEAWKGVKIGSGVTVLWCVAIVLLQDCFSSSSGSLFSSFMYPCTRVVVDTSADSELV